MDAWTGDAQTSVVIGCPHDCRYSRVRFPQSMSAAPQLQSQVAGSPAMSISASSWEPVNAPTHSGSSDPRATTTGPVQLLGAAIAHVHSAGSSVSPLGSVGSVPPDVVEGSVESVGLVLPDAVPEVDPLELLPSPGSPPAGSLGSKQPVKTRVVRRMLQRMPQDTWKWMRLVPLLRGRACRHCSSVSTTPDRRSSARVGRRSRHPRTCRCSVPNPPHSP